MDYDKPTTDPKPLKRDGSPPDEEDKPGKRIPDGDEPEASRGGSDPDQDDQSKSGKSLV